LARSTSAKVMPPPVEVPKTPVFLGSAVFTTSFHAAVASSIAAG
jgi:hypothetical protein